jgi:outer membrane protein TolC
MRVFGKIVLLFVVPVVVWAQSTNTNTIGTFSTNVVELTPDYISNLGEVLRTNNLALQAAAARKRAAEANVRSIKTWEDPMVRAGGMLASEMMRADDGDIVYGVEQRLPLFGKPQMARRVAKAEAETETAMEDYEFQRMRLELANALFRAALSEKRVEIGEQDLAWLETLARTAEGKYRANQAGLVEVLQLQNERAKRFAGLQTDRDQAQVDKLNLNRMLGRPLETPWPKLVLPPPAEPLEYNPKLIEFALKYEPRITVKRKELSQAKAMADLTARERLPEVSVGVEGRNYSGDGRLRQNMVVLSMNLPWFNRGKYQSAITRDREKAEAVSRDLADYELGAQEEVHQLLTRIASARREALVYRDEIIPRSESALRSAQSGWEANRDSVRDVLEARRMLLEARLMEARAITEQYQMLSELVLCCGLGDLQALQMLATKPITQP